jgi:hypothetical protein
LVLGFGIGVYVLWRIQEVLFLLVVSILRAAAIEPIVNRPRRGLVHVIDLLRYPDDTAGGIMTNKLVCVPA